MKRLVALTFFLAVSTPVGAQAVLDEIEAKIGSRAEELQRAESLLADPDPNRRIAAMEALLKSGDPAFIDKAKEVGLFSDDPRLRAAAIRAIFDAGGTFRAEFDIPVDDADLTAIHNWLRTFNGSWSEDGSTGYFGFTLGDFDEKQDCWKWLDSNDCALRMSGEEVLTADWSFNISGSSAMRLDETGALTGAFLVNGRGTPVTIRIPLM